MWWRACLARRSLRLSSLSLQPRLACRASSPPPASAATPPATARRMSTRSARASPTPQTLSWARPGPCSWVTRRESSRCGDRRQGGTRRSSSSGTITSYSSTDRTLTRLSSTTWTQSCHSPRISTSTSLRPSGPTPSSTRSTTGSSEWSLPRHFSRTSPQTGDTWEKRTGPG